MVWSVDGLGGGWSSASVASGTVYVTGMDAASQGQLFAFDLDGKPEWTAPATGTACVVHADGMPYAYSESGTVRLIKANPEAFEEISAFDVPKGAGEHWAAPTIANGRLYLRHGDSLMVYDISGG